MTKCPQCGTAVEAAQRFCSGCGTRLHGEAPAGDRNAVMHRPGGGRPDPFEVGGSDDANGDDFFSQFTPKSSLPADRPLPSRRSRRRFNPSLYPTGEVPSQMPDAGQRPSPAGEPPRPPAEPPRPAGEFWAAPAADDGAAHDDGPPTAAMSHDEIQEALADRQAPVPAEPPAEPFAFQPPAPPFPAAEAPIDPFAPPAGAGPGFGPGAGADARGEQDAPGAFVPPPAEAGPVGLGYEPPAPAPVLDQGEAEAEDVTMPDWFAELVDDGEPEPEPEAPTAAAPMPPTHGDRVEHDDWSAERSADAERAAAFWGAQGGPPAAAVPPAEPVGEAPQGSAFQAPPPPVQAPRGDGEASFTQLIRGIDDDPADRPIESPGFDPTGIVPLPPREQLEDDAELRAAQERAAAFWGVSKTPEPAEPAEPAAPFAAPGGPVPGAGAPAGDEGADARDRFALPADSWFAEGPGAQGDAGADGAEPRAPFAGPAYGDAPAAAPEHASGGPASDRPASDRAESDRAESDRAESDHDDELFADGWFTETAEHGPVDDGRGAHAAGPASAPPAGGMPALPPLPPAAGAAADAGAGAGPAAAGAAASGSGASGASGAPGEPRRGDGGARGPGGPSGPTGPGDAEQRRRGVRTIAIAAAAAVVLIAGAFGISALVGGGDDAPIAGDPTTSEEAPATDAPTEGGDPTTEAAPGPTDETPEPEQFEPVAFMSGSGNLRCQITPEGGAVCQVMERSFALPEGECYGPGYSGAAVGVNADGTYWPCPTGELAGGQVVEYDAPITAGQYTCSINYETGVTCSNGKGDGFTMEYSNGIQLDGEATEPEQRDVEPIG